METLYDSEHDSGVVEWKLRLFQHYVYTCMCAFRVTLAFKFHTDIHKYNTNRTMGYNNCLAYDMTVTSHTNKCKQHAICNHNIVVNVI